MTIIRMARVYTTEYGQIKDRDLPIDLMTALEKAVFKKNGMPDGRSPRSLAAWQDLEQHVRQIWMAK